MMQTHWTKLRKVFHPNQLEAGKGMRWYAQCPTSFLPNNDLVWIYFATRPPYESNLQYSCYPAYVNLNSHNLSEVVGIE